MPEADTERTLFLQRVLGDQERGALAPLDTYVRDHPSIRDFVLAEYEALLCQQHRGDPTRYVDAHQLATGGMGQVWLATDRLLGRKVVLKTIRGGAAVAHAATRLQREARILARLDHPGICRILDAFSQDGQWMLVLPLLHGCTLAERIERAQQAQPRPVCVTLRDDVNIAMGPLPAFIAWYASLVDAVHAAHGAGIVHRDLKPANLFVLDSGEPVVLDFGLALDAGEGDQRLTMSGEHIGTPLYMAPEQVEGRACDARTDVYALGVVLYEALTLARPFTGASRESTFRHILEGSFVAPRVVNSQIPKDLEAVCMKAIARDPSHRYETAEALRDDLLRVLRLEPTRARPPSGLRLAARSMRRHARVAAGAVGVVAVAAVGTLLWREATAFERRVEAEVSRGAARCKEHQDAVESHRGTPSPETLFTALTKLWALAESVPLDSPIGLCQRIHVARGLRQYHDDLAGAERLLNTVIDGIGAFDDGDWERVRARIATVEHIGILDHERPAAGSKDDVLGLALQERGLVRSRLREPASLEDFERSQSLLERTKNFHLLTNVHHDRAETFIRMGRYGEAENDLEIAERNYKEPRFGGEVKDDDGLSDDENGVFEIGVLRSHILRAKGQYREAKKGYHDFLMGWADRTVALAAQADSYPLVNGVSRTNHRFAHRALWYAECCIRAGGDSAANPEAAEYLGFVRKELLDGEVDRNAIAHQRYVEILDDWVARGSVDGLLTDLDQLQEICGSLYSEYFDLPALRGEALHKVLPGVTVVELFIEEGQLFAVPLCQQTWAGFIRLGSLVEVIRDGTVGLGALGTLNTSGRRILVHHGLLGADSPALRALSAKGWILHESLQAAVEQR